MKKLLFALLLWPSLAFGQCTGVFPANTLCGNLSGTPAPPKPFTATTGVIGPGSSTIGDFATWANTSGTQLTDQPFAGLAQGGLGGSQAAATAGQVPVFPGSGGAAVPGLPQIPLATNVTGNLAPSHLNSGTNASASTFWRGDGAWATTPFGNVFGGRLTVISGVPAPTNNNGNTVGGLNVYYAPYVGNQVTIYDGTNFLQHTFTSSDNDAVGLTLALGSNWAANTVYDVYTGLSSGNPVLCTVAWTNATTRATNLQKFRGIPTNATSATCRTTNTTTITCAQNQCSYLGTILTDAANAGQITYSYGGNGSGGPTAPARLSVWNMYNRLLTNGRVIDTGTRYTYGPAGSLTIRQDRASANMQVNYVLGLTEDQMFVYRFDNIATAATTGSGGGSGIGIDVTNTFSILPVCSVVAPTANAFSGDCNVPISFYPTLGSHFIAATQQGDGTTALTFDNVSSDMLSVSLPM